MIRSMTHHMLIDGEIVQCWTAEQLLAWAQVYSTEIAEGRIMVSVSQVHHNRDSEDQTFHMRRIR